MPDVVDIRALGALRFVDATTRARVTAPLRVTAPGVRFVRNLSGAYTVAAAPGLQAHVETFPSPPASPALGSVSLAVSVSDPGGRYLDRASRLQLPRTADPAQAADPASLFQPVLVPLYPSPSAPLEPGWAVVRISLRDSGGAGLAGAYLRLRRATQPTEQDPPLARGLADARGEAMVAVAGIPVTNFEAEEEDGPVLSSAIDAVLEAYFDENAGAPPDPDVIESRRLLPPANPLALARASAAVQLTSGRQIALTVVIPA
jgi:hypothetical protein